MKIRAIAALLFILVSISAFGQKHVKITGYVRDADGSPLELVLVQIKNTLNGAMTMKRVTIRSPRRRAIPLRLFSLAWDIIRQNVFYPVCNRTCG